MLSRPIDLRSDTVTRPSAGMRDAMARAEVGDDIYGEDPTVNELEALAAELTGKPAALFVPSGSMANLIAQLVYVRPGDEVICGAMSHILFYESGSGAALAGALYQVIAERSQFTADDVAARIAAGSFYAPKTALVWCENTHNRAGGAIFPQQDVEAIGALCRHHGLPLHLDGARLLNAAVATGRAVADLARPVDSLSFCLSKGLGAPIGSVLCGSAEFRNAALRFRKMLGGAMRQVGVIAAAGLWALKHNVARLADDHARARRLAEGLASVPGLTIDVAATQTNIVIVGVDDAAGLAARSRAQGVLFNPIAAHKVRLLTHLDVGDDDIERAIDVLTRAARGPRGG